METNMQASPPVELEKVRALIDAGELPDNQAGTAAWCLGRLPDLYGQFVQTCDIRYGDEIRRLVSGMLAMLSDAELKQAILGQLLALHERLGIPALAVVMPKRKAG
jgi:hypothetical protein